MKQNKITKEIVILGHKKQKKQQKKLLFKKKNEFNLDFRTKIDCTVEKQKKCILKMQQMSEANIQV